MNSPNLHSLKHDPMSFSPPNTNHHLYSLSSSPPFHLTLIISVSSIPRCFVSLPPSSLSLSVSFFRSPISRPLCCTLTNPVSTVNTYCYVNVRMQTTG